MRARYHRASHVLAAARDVVHERPDDAAPPAWCARRGWTSFLAALPDDVVAAAERDGLASVLPALHGAPASLVALARDVVDATRLPSHAAADVRDVAAFGASPRKRAQVAAVASLVDDLARGCARVVDLGSGHGHLTRHLASALRLPAVGMERDAGLVGAARALTDDTAVRFEADDVLASPVALTPRCLVVGLHACGALGDRAVELAAGARAPVALVGCCPQKRAGDRAPMGSPLAETAAALTLGRAALGLANVTDGDDGVEDDLETRTRARVHRLAARALLAAQGLALSPGEEMRGVNRRRATGSFEALAAACAAARGMPSPTEAARDEALREAWRVYALARRWALPRAMLARLVEVWVALDRAAALEAQGYEARVVTAFARAVSPRNVAVLARPT